MRVEILGKALKDTDTVTGQHYSLTHGDVVTVPDALGSTWCSRGWAKDVDGNVPTGERKPGAQRLNPRNLKIGGK